MRTSIGAHGFQHRQQPLRTESIHALVAHEKDGHALAVQFLEIALTLGRLVDIVLLVRDPLNIVAASGGTSPSAPDDRAVGHNLVMWRRGVESMA